MKVQLFGRWKALDMHARRDEAHRVHRDAMGQQRRQDDLAVDAAGSQERHRVALSVLPTVTLFAVRCGVGTSRASPRSTPHLFGFLSARFAHEFELAYSSATRNRRQKADLLRRMVTRIPETIIFCHALNVSANKNNRTTRFHAGWVREQGWMPCAQGTPQGVK